MEISDKSSNKFLLVSQSRSGSTKLFFTLQNKFGIDGGIKELQQMPPDFVVDNDWKRLGALGVLTDSVFYQSIRKKKIINNAIQYCMKNNYFIVGLFRDNKLKRYISEKYAYHKDNFSMSNKDDIMPWVLDTKDIEYKIKCEEIQQSFVINYVRKNAKFDYIFSFEQLYEKPEGVSITINGFDVKLNLYRPSYIETQRKLYKSIVNIYDIPGALINKYPLFLDSPKFCEIPEP